MTPTETALRRALEEQWGVAHNANCGCEFIQMNCAWPRPKELDEVVEVVAERERHENIENLIDKRNVAFRTGNFHSAEGIRKQLLNMGVTIEDTGHGTRWRSEAVVGFMNNATASESSSSDLKTRFLRLLANDGEFRVEVKGWLE